jgi:hypothetical protein
MRHFETRFDRSRQEKEGKIEGDVRKASCASVRNVDRSYPSFCEIHLPNGNRPSNVQLQHVSELGQFDRSIHSRHSHASFYIYSYTYSHDFIS